MATIDDVVQKFSDLRDATRKVRELQAAKDTLQSQIGDNAIALAEAKVKLAQIQVEAKKLARDVL